MAKNSNKDENQSQNFFTGFVLGGIISAAGFYLTMTKSGRKISKGLLKHAEEFGEKGEEYFENFMETPLVAKTKEAAGTKINNIIGKLKTELRSAKKTVDSGT